MMLWKCCTHYASKVGKLSSGHKNGKGQFLILIPKKSNAKEFSNYHTIALISNASQVKLKIPQARLQQYMNHELPDVQAGFRNDRGSRAQTTNIHWITEKAREFQKNIYFCFIDYAKAFDCVDHKKMENSSRHGNTKPLYLSPEKPICRSRSNSLDMEQWTGSKLGKEYIKAVYCYLLI